MSRGSRIYIISWVYDHYFESYGRFYGAGLVEKWPKRLKNGFNGASFLKNALNCSKASRQLFIARRMAQTLGFYDVNVPQKNGTSGKGTGLVTQKNGTSGKGTGLVTEKNGTSGKGTGLEARKNGTSGKGTGLEARKNGTSGKGTGLEARKNGTSGKATGLVTQKNKTSEKEPV